MGAFEDYRVRPNVAGARELGRLAVYLVAPDYDGSSGYASGRRAA